MANAAPRAAATATAAANGRAVRAIEGGGRRPMTKRDIVEKLIAPAQDCTRRKSETIVNAMFDAMTGALARGQRIEIRGFGSFAVKHRRARQGRNPKTGALVKVDAKLIPFFRAGKELRTEVNGAAGKGR
jgi:integration host factor subunit beta